MKHQHGKNSYVPNVFEYVFYINNKEDGTICSREFTLNDFNPNTKNSYNTKKMVDDIVGLNTPSGNVGIIPNMLKKESMNYSWGHYGWRYFANIDEVEPVINRYEADLNEKEKEFYFFEVRKVNLKTFNGYTKRGKDGRFIRNQNNPTTHIASGTFDANFFPRKVRHFVDIRRKHSEIVETIGDYLTDKTPEMVKH